MKASVARAFLAHKSRMALEARAALRLAELMLDRPWTRSASLWIDALVTIAESDR